ncbi:MAG: hypothetical protein ACI9MS_002352 [Glaciecola sp.]|jgi:hypothetical protein
MLRETTDILVIDKSGHLNLGFFYTTTDLVINRYTGKHLLLPENN